ncbi:hypothetical protein HCN44_007699 [Aphidius gifuensis]|uniref:Peptidase S1 domain-containing protein n=1 Tax=Aphidius gifuensis TaxID=684658 RepID=A0A835CPL4_APHGI|nr:hypothetical protein HCN44_007699 [Aphidius gifuensis]
MGYNGCALYGDDPKEYSVRSGSSYRSSEGKIHQVTKIIVHDDFNATIVDYDIAVIQVDPLFEFDDSRQPVKLPDLNGQDNDDDNTGTVVGWGAFSDLDDKKLSQVLKSTTMPKVEKNECIEDYKDSYVVTDRELCFGFRSGHDDACKGDSGGPLYNKDEILIGITSWGDECAAKNSPGIYTRVQSFRDWIQEKTGV